MCGGVGTQSAADTHTFPSVTHSRGDRALTANWEPFKNVSCWTATAFNTPLQSNVYKL